MGLTGALKGVVLAGLAGVERLARNGVGADDSLREIRNFLLLQYPRALGTAVHATPLIAALRQAVPGCGIAVAASGFALDVFRNHPGVDRLIETPNPLQDLHGAVRVLRREYPFAGERHGTLTSTGNERTRILAMAMLSGASPRVGFTVAPQFYARPLVFDSALSQIANNLRIVEALGHAAVAFEPAIFYSEADLAEARQTLAEAGVGDGDFVAVFVTQTSVTQRKSWRAERFRAVAKFLRTRHGAHIVFIGTAAESAAIDQLRGSLSFKTTNVAGRTGLQGLAALMSLCNVGLTLDTGPMHIGRAVGLPMAIIAPAWSPPVEWLPLGIDRFRILKNAEMDSAPSDYVIDEVSVDEVQAALEEIIARYPRTGLKKQ